MPNITPISAFRDNYIWSIQGDQPDRVLIVDPGDAKPVLDFLAARDLSLAAILITHHHQDHVGGIAELTAVFPVPVYGPDSAIAGVSRPVGAGDELDLLGIGFCVLAVPGHTLDHIAYFVAGDQPLLFCGDTLFAAGCGRLFEGSAAQMYQSLNLLAQLPENTKLYCAHEYTLANIAFAAAVEPHNPALPRYAERARVLRAAGEPSLPTSLDDECAVNPFLRCDLPQLKDAAERHGGERLESPVLVFAAIRRWKDQF